MSAPAPASASSRETLQKRLLLGECAEIAMMHPQSRPFSTPSKLQREQTPPACIAMERVYRLPATNSDVFLVGKEAERVFFLRPSRRMPMANADSLGGRC